MTFRPSRPLALAAFALAAIPALAGTTFTISAGFAPNFYGSPSYAGWQTNFMSAITGGQNAAGSLAQPTGYQNVIGGTFDSRRNVATNFQTFNGQAGYGGAAFANELGNRATYGIHLVSTSAFNLSSFEDGFASTLDPSLGFDYAPTSYAGYTFSAGRVGINYGANGVKGGGDDTVYDASNPGSDSSPINELNLVSGGIADAVLTTDPGTTNQNKIDNEAMSLGGYDLSVLYRLNGADLGAGTVHFQAVPEPSTIAALGLGGLAMLRRRKR